MCVGKGEATEREAKKNTVESMLRGKVLTEATKAIPLTCLVKAMQKGLPEDMLTAG